MYLIDTNIFLEFLLEQDKNGECIALFKKVISGNLKASISRFSLYSIEILLTKTNKLEALKKFLIIIKNSKGLRIINTDISDDEQIVELMIEYNLSFDDALNYYICKTLNLKIISYDKHFDKTPIKRLTPVDF